MHVSRISQTWNATKAFGMAIGVHLFAAALIVISTMNWEPFRPPSLEGLEAREEHYGHMDVDYAAFKDHLQREYAR